VEVDRAVALAPQIEALLKQGKQERGFAQDSFAALATLMESAFDGDGR
jgi:flagellum-specific ATP synthase